VNPAARCSIGELPVRRLIATVTLFASLLASPALANAQAASPAATPAVECVYPELPPGTPTPVEASPAAMEEMGDASPEADEQAEEPAGDASPDPVGTPAPPEGEPATQADIDRVIAGIENVFACYNDGDYLGFAALQTPESLLADFGTSNPYDLPAIFASFGPPTSFELVSVDNVLLLPDDRVYFEMVYRFGNVLTKEGTYGVVRDGILLGDAGTVELPVDVPADVQTADVTLVDYAFEISQTTFDAGPPIAFSVANAGQYPHEFALMRLPDGVTADQVLDDLSLLERATYVGGTFAMPGQTAPPMVVVDLAAGTYVAVCFVDMPGGVPHVARGMVAEITIE